MTLNVTNRRPVFPPAPHTQFRQLRQPRQWREVTVQNPGRAVQIKNAQLMQRCQRAERLDVSALADIQELQAGSTAYRIQPLDSPARLKMQRSQERGRAGKTGRGESINDAAVHPRYRSA